MLLVLDTNVWLSELSLRSPLGAATRFFIRRKGARIALPEVVRLEVEQNLRARLSDFISKIHDNHRQLLTVFGALKEVVLPDGAAVDARVGKVFSTLDVELLEIPLSLGNARSSFLKTISKTPPSDKTQEFKDGVLWSDCVSLLEQDAVYLVTADKAFYQDRKYENGLASNLREEISAAKHPLSLLPSLADLLRDFRTEVDLDEHQLAEAFIREFKDSIEGTLARNEFELGPRARLTKVLYVTENPDRLYLQFSMDFEAREVAGDGRKDGVLTLRGDGTYDAKTRRFGELRNFGEQLRFVLPDGSDKEVKNIVIHVGSLTLGHKEVAHTVRYQLD